MVFRARAKWYWRKFFIGRRTGCMKTMEVFFPGGKRVDARIGDMVVRTDQPIHTPNRIRQARAGQRAITVNKAVKTIIQRSARLAFR